jgi:hypothetical protein
LGADVSAPSHPSVACWLLGYGGPLLCPVPVTHFYGSYFSLLIPLTV